MGLRNCSTRQYLVFCIELLSNFRMLHWPEQYYTESHC
jgi:hypothetical protein